MISGVMAGGLRTFILTTATFCGATTACLLLVSTEDLAGGSGDASAGDADGDAARASDAGISVDPCPALRGAQANAAWPTEGGCMTRVGRSRFVGPQRAKLSWSVRYTDAVGGYGAPIIDRDGFVYVGFEHFWRGFASFRDDGGLRWEADAGNVSAPATISAMGDVLTGQGAALNGLAALRPDGTRRWFYALPVEIDSSPAVDDDGTIFFTSLGTSQSLFALQSTGSLKWSKPLDGGSGTVALGAFGRLYLARNDGRLSAFDRASGNEVWVIDLGTKLSTPVVGVASSRTLLKSGGGEQAITRPSFSRQRVEG
jgi:hypothetical protein